MKRAYKIMPVYAGDVSGACSALYELGGMVVIHDPSGCNSTYNTHDEVRWDKQESLIFISGLTDVQAITGDDKKLIDDCVKAALIHNPEFIAIANSPIPYVNGTDFEYIAREISKRTGIKTFAVKTNAFHDYVKGAGTAFTKVAECLVEKDDSAIINKSEKIGVNILGTTPLDFTSEEVSFIKKFLEDSGFFVVSNWSYGCNYETIKKSGNADVNLVVSSTGFEAAKILEKRFGIPFVVGSPIGGMKEILISAIKEAYANKKSTFPYKDKNTTYPCEDKKSISEDEIIVGEGVFALSLAKAIEVNTGIRPRVIISTESNYELFAEGDLHLQSEEEIESVLKNAKKVCGDPVLKPLVGGKTDFVEVSHFALSGRLYTDKHKNIFEII